MAKDDLVERTAAALPYELTAGQRESLDSLRQDCGERLSLSG